MKEDLTDIFESENLLEAQLISDRLKAVGIQNFIDNVDSPFDGLVAADQVKTVRVLPKDAGRAREIVAAFEAEKGKG